MAKPRAGIGQELKHALETGDFCSAVPLIEEYGNLTMQALRTSRSLSERQAVLDEASSFLQDRLHLARVLRSHIAAQIAASSRLISYNDNPITESTWHFEA
jgi:hypothetical protein